MIKVNRSVLLVLILLLSASLAFAGGTHEKSPAVSASPKPGGAMQPAAAMKPAANMQPAATAMSPSVAMSFTSLKEAETYASSGPTLLYFCTAGDSACRSTVASLDSGTTKLPANAHVFVVDYSKASDLRMRYNVNMDDTFVKIGPLGHSEMMWSGGGADGVRMHLTDK